MTEVETEVVWRGAEALRPFLVPVADLEPFPGNPRRGDIEWIMSSLERFGQVWPVLTDANTGRRIVAHHHVRLAAVELGWTHVAAMPNEFADQDEARAFMLADNRLPELAGYDQQLLVEHLRFLADLDKLAGTGYTKDDVDDELAKLRSQLDKLDQPPAAPLPPTDLREVVLFYSVEQHERFETLVGIVAAERGVVGTSDGVLEALEVAARTLNQGA